MFDIVQARNRKAELHMTNTEKFNQLINSCGNPRLVYNALLKLSKPCVQQTDDMTDKREVIVGKLLALFDETEGD